MRAVVLCLALLFGGCSIFSSFNTDNPQSCVPHPELCTAGTVCDPTLGRCVPPTGPVSDAALSDLSVAGGVLSPAFAPGTLMYTATLSALTPAAQFFPTAPAGVTIDVNGTPVQSGGASPAIAVGPSVVMVTIIAHLAGRPDQTYSVVVMRAPPDYLKASNTGAPDVFGTSVSLSGDTLAVGAPNESSSALGINGNQMDNNSKSSGAVYIFVRTAAGWTQQAYIKASASGPNNQFGSSVSLAGDTLAVGAVNENSSAAGVDGNQADIGATSSGAVYVFQRTGDIWAQQAYIKASNPMPNNFFGCSVAVAGDTLAVGAYAEGNDGRGINMPAATNKSGSSGAVYVFQRSVTGWTQQAYIKADNADTGDLFGRSVALENDTLVVGAPNESSASSLNPNDNNLGQSGAVYVFQRTGTLWMQQAYLKAGVPTAMSLFGMHVALSGDTLAVAVEQDSSKATGINGNPSDSSAPNSGAVYVFQRTGTRWDPQAYLKASNAETSDFFGRGLALSGDLLAVGAPQEDSAASGLEGSQRDNSTADAGAVYLFQRTGATWAQRAYVKASNPDARDNFGSSVSLSKATLVCGAPGEGSNAKGINGDSSNNSMTNAGAVYVFR